MDCINPKKRDGRGFLRAGSAAPGDFPKAKPKANPEEQPCSPRKNTVQILIFEEA